MPEWQHLALRRGAVQDLKLPVLCQSIEQATTRLDRDRMIFGSYAAFMKAPHDH
jgi:hypothetical protein